MQRRAALVPRPQLNLIWFCSALATERQAMGAGGAWSMPIMAMAMKAPASSCLAQWSAARMSVP